MGRAVFILINMASVTVLHAFTECICKQGNDKPVMKCPFLRHLKSCGLNKRMNFRVNYSTVRRLLSGDSA